MKMKLVFVVFLLLFPACGSSKQFDAIPSNIGQNVPKEAIAMIAESYTFAPEVIRVKAGLVINNGY